MAPAPPFYTLTYNGKGRAKQIATAANSNNFFYDARDIRIQKADSQGTRLYHLEGDNLEATYDLNGQLHDKYLRGVVVDEIVNGYHYPTSDANAKQNITFHHDHLNSVTAQTGPGGEQLENTRYDAFGLPLNFSVPGTGNNLLYTGREYDRDTKLYYYRARYL